jgi:hypothetical protein
MCKWWHENNASDFFSENVIAITMKFIWIIHTYFANKRLFCPQTLLHFQHTFANLGNTLYINVVKFPVLTSEHFSSDTGKL